MLLPPPPPPAHLPDLCHYQGDCAHHPVISSLSSVPGAPDFIHVVSLAAVTSLTIILVFTVSCIIVYRWVELVSLSSVICNMSTHFCLRTMNYFFFQKSDE